ARQQDEVWEQAHRDNSEFDQEIALSAQAMKGGAMNGRREPVFDTHTRFAQSAANDPHPFELNDLEKELHAARSKKNPYPSLGNFFIWPFMFAARAFAGTLMLIIWFLIVGPIWFAVLLRTIAAFSISTVIALFTGATPPSPERLDTV